MKIKNLLALAAIATMALVSCKKDEQPSETGMTINPTSLTFSADSALTATVAVTSSRDWKVTNAPEWASFDVNGKDVTQESVAASSTPVTMTVTVLKNTSVKRSQTVKVNGGTLAYQNLTITQEGGGTKGKGTKEDPFNVAAAIEKAKEIGQAAASTEYYYIKGYITSIKEVSTSYGNASFYIGDNKGDAENLLYCFQVKYLAGKSFTSEGQIKVDDEVVMYAQIYNYMGNTPETSGKGASNIYTLNGEGGGDTPDPTKAEAKTVKEFITLADKDNYYKLTGTVSSFSADYCSFDLTDATGSIYVYSVEQASKTQYSSIIKDGGTITLSGKYDYYTAKSQHEVINAVILDYKESQQKTVTTEKVSDVIAAAVGDTIVLNNAIVVAAAKTGYVVTDAQNSGHIFIYQTSAGTDTQTVVGDKVNVKAIRAAYSSMPQLNDPATTVVSSGSQVTWPTPDDITSTFDSFTSTSVKYISYKGSLSVNGNYYNITVDGATKIGSILPSEAAKAYIGLPNTTFKGYYIYTSSSKYIYMVFTEAQTSSEPYLIVSPESINVDATAGTTTITISSNSAWTVESNNPDFTLDAASGSGNGTITVTYPQNATESAKNATITIASGSLSKNVTITQAKAGAAKYTWELKSSELTTGGGTVTSGGATWTFPTADYIGFDTSNGRGAQIGSSSKPQASYTLSTDYFASPKVISSITVNASMAGSGDAKLSIAVGGVDVLTDQALTTTATDYTVNNVNKSGTVEIKYTATKKAYYLKSVTIEY